MLPAPARLAALLCLAAAACVDGRPDPADAGPLPCTGEGDPSIAAGAHGDVWDPLTDGAEVPSFDRPQGGVGTHLTVRFTGFPEDQTDFKRLQFVIQANDDFEAGLISEYATIAFPLDCEADGSLLLVDVPVRFAVGVPDAATIDGVAATMTTTMELQDGSTLSSDVDVVLRESDFIPPAWWEDSDG